MPVPSDLYDLAVDVFSMDKQMLDRDFSRYLYDQLSYRASFIRGAQHLGYPSIPLGHYIHDIMPLQRLSNKTFDTPIMPQSEGGSQNVKFLDNTEETSHNVPGQYDEIRMMGVDSSTPLGEFFSRPVLIDNFS